MKKKWLIFITISFLLFSKDAFSQQVFNHEVYYSPEISVGYTFGAKFNIGFGFDFGILDNNYKNLRYGACITYNLIQVNDRFHGQRFHRQRCLNLMFQNEYVDIKIGYGRMRNGWGYENKNSCIARGLSTNLSLQFADVYSPKLGYRGFYYNKKTWAWFEKQYNSIYIGYEYYNKK